VHLDLWQALAGAIVGFTVGLTGMGGGALMTPILVLFFGVNPGTAVSSDLLSSLVMKPVGASVHLHKGTVNWDLARWLAVGSVPAAFAGVFVLRRLGRGPAVANDMKTLLGWALLVAALAMVAKSFLTYRSRTLPRPSEEAAIRIKRIATVMIGLAGGLIVGMTSVGSGSLMIVMLVLLYPRLSSRQLVGTDLVQAIPLVGAATLSHVLFGHVDLGLTASLLVGSLPGVYIGAHVSSRAPDVIIRPALVVILLVSALKLLNVTNTALVWSIGILVVVGAPLWAATEAALRPEWQWKTAGRRRTFWVTALSVAAPFGVGFPIAIIYVATARRQLRAVSSRASQPAPAAAPALA
jgi:uncharacterized membrane protein YfcA